MAGFIYNAAATPTITAPIPINAATTSYCPLPLFMNVIKDAEFVCVALDDDAVDDDDDDADDDDVVTVTDVVLILPVKAVLFPAIAGIIDEFMTADVEEDEEEDDKEADVDDDSGHDADCGRLLTPDDWQRFVAKSNVTIAK